MRFLYSVEEGAIGWRVRHAATYLAESLTLGQAIKHARQAGQKQHERTGCAVTVELAIPEKSLPLVEYIGQNAEATPATPFVTEASDCGHEHASVYRGR